MIKFMIFYIVVAILSCMGLFYLFKDDIVRREIEWLKTEIVIMSCFWIIFVLYGILLSIIYMIEDKIKIAKIKRRYKNGK